MPCDIMRPARRIGALLLIPLLLTLLARSRWKPGALLLVLVLLCGGAWLARELAPRIAVHRAYRRAVGLALGAVDLLGWMNAAVGGILGDDPANQMYLGVLLIGLTGAGLVRLEPRGMAEVLLAMAFAVGLIPAIALLIGTPAFANGVAAVFGLHAGFAALFAGAAWLFRRAGAPLPAGGPGEGSGRPAAGGRP